MDELIINSKGCLSFIAKDWAVEIPITCIVTLWGEPMLTTSLPKIDFNLN